MAQVRASSLTLLAAALLACGSDEKDPLDPSTFAGAHIEEITYDCNQSVQCAVQEGDPLEESPQDACIKRTAKLLNDEAGMRDQFVANYNRCAHFVVCVYVDCAVTDAASYGETQRDKVTYDCQQEVACMTQQGVFAGDANIAVQNCVAANIPALDNGAVFNSTTKRDYERRFGECMALQACDFMACFPY